MKYIGYVIVGLFGWFVLSVLLRRARIWQRKKALARLERDFGRQFTEREVFGDELELHL